MKGIAYIGVVKELERRGALHKVEGYAGASIGSLFAALLATGYTHREIEDFFWSENPYQVLRTGCCSCWNYLRLILNKGQRSMKPMKKWLKKLLAVRGFENSTLGEVYNQTGIELVIMGANLTKVEPVMFHHGKYPDVKLLDALLYSMCLPVLFEPMKMGEDTVVDGAAIESYPLWVFNNMKALYAGEWYNIPRQEIPDNVVGFKLYNGDQENNRKLFYGTNPTSTFGDYVSALATTVSTQVERNSTIAENYFCRTIPINTFLYNDFESELGESDMKDLMKLGEQAAKNTNLI